MFEVGKYVKLKSGVSNLDLEAFSVNPELIERLLNGEAFQILAVGDHDVSLFRRSGWVIKRYLVPINIVLEEAEDI